MRERPYLARSHGRWVINPVKLGWYLNKKQFGVQHWQSLKALFNKESGWKWWKRNPKSGACGIPQALPCSKIPKFTSLWSQIKWGLKYIRGRYGNPSAAWAHSQAYGWY